MCLFSIVGFDNEALSSHAVFSLCCALCMASEIFCLEIRIFRIFFHLPKGFAFCTKSTADLFNLVNIPIFSQG